jgi:hypothetical protein
MTNPSNPHSEELRSRLIDILYATGYFDASTAERYEEVLSVADKLLTVCQATRREGR